MIFVADESVDQQIVIELRKSGHQVTFVAEMEPGISDKAVLELANKQNAVLITADKDFGEIVFRQRQIITGVILIRLAGLSQENKSLVVSRMIEKHLKLGRLFYCCFPYSHTHAEGYTVLAITLRTVLRSPVMRKVLCHNTPVFN